MNPIYNLILQQKIAARKNIAYYSTHNNLKKIVKSDRINQIIQDENDFLNYDFAKIDKISDLIELLNRTRFRTNNAPTISLTAEMPINLPGAPAENPSTNPDKDNKPMLGNLMTTLQQEVVDEIDRMDRKKIPSQNDITRWALKDAVLAYYQGLNLPPNTKIVETIFDERLVSKLAPDFDIIYEMWLDRLYNLTRRDDKYTLDIAEYDNAVKDVSENETGMRGSAFEKQLDRYRKEFMNKIKR